MKKRYIFVSVLFAVLMVFPGTIPDESGGTGRASTQPCSNIEDPQLRAICMATNEGNNIMLGMASCGTLGHPKAVAVCQAIKTLSSLVDKILSLFRSRGKYKLFGRLDLDVLNDMIRSANDGFKRFFSNQNGWIDKMKRLWEQKGTREVPTAFDVLGNEGFQAHPSVFFDFLFSTLHGWEPHGDIYGSSTYWIFYNREETWIETAIKNAVDLLPLPKPIRRLLGDWLARYFGNAWTILYDGKSSENIEKAIRRRLKVRPFNPAAGEHDLESMAMIAAGTLKVLKTRSNVSKNMKTLNNTDRIFGERLENGTLTPEEYQNLKLRAELAGARATTDIADLLALQEERWLKQETLKGHIRAIHKGQSKAHEVAILRLPPFISD